MCPDATKVLCVSFTVYVHMPSPLKHLWLHWVLASLHTHSTSVYVISDGRIWLSPSFSVCLYMWLYLIYFLLYTIINPTVPVAWLHFGYTFYPVHDGVRMCWMCMFVCILKKLFLFFLLSADLWACLVAGVCVYVCACVCACLHLVFLNTVTALACTLWLSRRD